MSHRPRALVIRTAGTNCDAEMIRAFQLAGASTDLLHLERLIADPARLESYDLLGFPGGFSYGDDVASGRLFAMRARERLYPALRSAALRGCPMIGACNGFQVMVQVGLLPGPGTGGSDPRWPADRAPDQTVALSHNSGGSFIDQWVRVEFPAESRCVWTAGIADRFKPSLRDDVLRLPIAHGEGRFIPATGALLSAIESGGQVAVRYIDNVNGSANAIAGICDSSGRIFALMPHPERYLSWLHHPYWTRLGSEIRSGGLETPGLMMFRNAVEAATPSRV
ncbi:MAG: phosphoribosylformylglycinamidine synthase subunit PurQ [Phycisphaerales bacterium]